MDYETIRLRLRDIMLELISASFMGVTSTDLNQMIRKLRECDHPGHAVMWMSELLERSSRVIASCGFSDRSENDLDKVNAALTAFQKLSEELIDDWTKHTPLPVDMHAQAQMLLDAYDLSKLDTAALYQQAMNMLNAYQIQMKAYQTDGGWYLLAVPSPAPAKTTTSDESRSEPPPTLSLPPRKDTTP